MPWPISREPARTVRRAIAVDAPARIGAVAALEDSERPYSSATQTSIEVVSVRLLDQT